MQSSAIGVSRPALGAAAFLHARGARRRVSVSSGCCRRAGGDPGRRRRLHLAAAASGKCLEVAGGSTANGALLSRRPASPARPGSSGGLPAAPGSSTWSTSTAAGASTCPVPTTSGLQLQQWGCGDGTQTNQQWTLRRVGRGTGKYRIISVATGLCVSDKDGSTAGNNPIVQETCSAIARMQWSFNHGRRGTAPTTTGLPGTPTVAADGTGTTGPCRRRSTRCRPTTPPGGSSPSRPAPTARSSRVPANKPYITLQGLRLGGRPTR